MQEKAQKTQQLLQKDTERKEQFVQFTTLEVHFVMSGECAHSLRVKLEGCTNKVNKFNPDFQVFLLNPYQFYFYWLHFGFLSNFVKDFMVEPIRSRIYEHFVFGECNFFKLAIKIKSKVRLLPDT